MKQTVWDIIVFDKEKWTNFSNNYIPQQSKLNEHYKANEIQLWTTSVQVLGKVSNMFQEVNGAFTDLGKISKQKWSTHLASKPLWSGTCG